MTSDVKREKYPIGSIGLMMIYLMNWIGLEFLSKYFKYNSQTS
jgi:hypothetical protein